MTTFRTFCQYHLGDQLVHLNFLHRLARENPGAEFVHAVPLRYLSELLTATQGIEGVRLETIEAAGCAGLNAWRGAGGWWYGFPQRHDFVAAHLAWFEHLARAMDVENPIRTREDLLFEFPALGEPAAEECDVLLIDSPPMSGQFSGYDLPALIQLETQLRRAGRRIVNTCGAQGRSLVDYGRLASQASLIVGVATGPMWLTYHAGARQARRLWLLDHERVEIFGDEKHASTVARAREILKAEGWL